MRLNQINQSTNEAAILKPIKRVEECEHIFPQVPLVIIESIRNGYFRRRRYVLV